MNWRSLLRTVMHIPILRLLQTHREERDVAARVRTELREQQHEVARVLHVQEFLNFPLLRERRQEPRPPR